MKKLKLDLQGLNAEVLTRSQLKKVLGGDGGSGGSGGGSLPCFTNAECQNWYGEYCYCLTRIYQCGCVS
ncbi:MAG: hypothetical protein ABI208_09500 [Ginsengibacter sp.]